MGVVKPNNISWIDVVGCGHLQSAKVLYLAGIVMVGDRPAPFQGHMLGRNPHLHDLHRLDPTKARNTNHEQQTQIIFPVYHTLGMFCVCSSLVTCEWTMDCKTIIATYTLHNNCIRTQLLQNAEVK